MKGKTLRPNVGIGVKYAKPTIKLIELMYDDLLIELESIFLGQPYKYAMGAFDEDKPKKDKSLTDEITIILAILLLKWQKRFDRVADVTTALMILETLKNSSVTLKSSLRDIAQEIAIDPEYTSPELEEILKASSEEAKGLIKAIPAQAIAEVQGQAMRGIINGTGMRDIVFLIKKKYKSNIKRVKNIASDQARKAYVNINLVRLNAFGIKKFVWVHTNRSKEPRPLHVHLNGHIFDVDNPPYIGDMYGNAVYGFPGQLPNCKCVFKPQIDFNNEATK